jgi:regulator of sigma E protease
LDSNVNPGPASPEPNPPSKPHDIAQPGPIDPATGQPDHTAEVSAVKSWFRENAFSLVITVAAVAAVCTWLDPVDTLKVVIGLGFIIFIHELGHFVAAKWCDVHVRTFSIGFGPAVPFCSYKWGETTYMVGIIPLGGYVQMVGEGETGEGDEEGEEDPRSFKKKSVGQRMLIISAGVIMNVILGMACFVAAYLHGVKEKPATVASVESGSAAWRSGIRTGDRVAMISGRENPTFDDIRPYVMTSGKGEAVAIGIERDGKRLPEPTEVVPIRDEGQRFPTLGVAPPYRLELIYGAKQTLKPYFPGTPAAEASRDGKGFEAGDRIIGMTDPDPAKQRQVTPVADYKEYYRRMVLLAKEPITFQVQRRKSEGEAPEVAQIVVKPAFRHNLGMRLRMGEVAAVREGGPAKKAGVVPLAGSPQPTHGDRIKAVMLPPDKDGKRVWYVVGPVDWTKPGFQVPNPKDVDVRPLDPLLLPHQLNAWADAQPTNGANWNVELVVTRAAQPTDVSVRMSLVFDPSYRFDHEMVNLPNSPLPLSGLGLAYQVEGVVDAVTPGGPAANAKTTPGELDQGFWHRVKRSLGMEGQEVAPGGDPVALQPGDDVIVGVRCKSRDENGKVHPGPWKDDLKVGQWAYADAIYQMQAEEVDIRITRKSGEVVTITITGTEDTEWGLDDRGLRFMPEEEIQKAADVGDAMRLGALRTVRFIKTVYMSLGGYVRGNISVKTLSGPLTIANVSYKLAGEDFWQFLLFLGMISVNLAVVNFLPIPVLDGGHMVFLILEKILGRPVPERMFAVAMYAGLFLILGLMVFVLFLDVGRLFFGMF